MRWIYQVATCDAGEHSKLLWRHIAELVKQPENAKTHEIYRHGFKDLVDSLSLHPLLSTIALRAHAEPVKNYPSQGATLGILLKMERAVGTPCVELSGTDIQVKAKQSLLSKLLAQRQTTHECRSKSPTKV